MGVGAKGFTCFPELPKEIRQKIWKLAQLRRIVSVLANRESWNHTLKSYVAIHDFFVPLHFYFNAARDTLYIPELTYSFDLMLSLRQFGEHLHHRKIRSLAMPQSSIECLHDLRDLKEATNLDELFIITKSYGYEGEMPGVETLLPRKTRPRPDEEDLDLWASDALEDFASGVEKLKEDFPDWNMSKLIAIQEGNSAYNGLSYSYTK